MGKQAKRKKERRLLNEASASVYPKEFEGIMSARYSRNHDNSYIKTNTFFLNFFRTNIHVVILIIVVGLIGYANGLDGQFLSADDIPGIVLNESLKDFIFSLKTLNLIQIYASAIINIFGPNAVVFHILSLSLHIINTLLVMLLTYLLFGRRISFYSSIIFCLLPSGSEAVFWISGVGYLFNALFSLACVNLFFIYRTTKKFLFLFLSIFVYVLALIVLQNPWILTIPMIIVALDIFTPKDKVSYNVNFVNLFLKRYGAYLIYFALAAVYWFVFVSGKFQARVSSLVTDYYFDPAKSTPLVLRLPYTIYKATELYLVPLRLSFFHEETLTKEVYYFMVVTTFVVFGLIIWLLRKKSNLGGLLLAILFSISPTFSPVQIAWFIAERYLYLGGAFFSMILGLSFNYLNEKTSVKNLTTFIFITLLTFYALRLITRANDFKSSKTLWLATQKTAPNSYRVYNNLGDVYSNEGDWPKAIESFKKSIELAPDYADAIHNLGYTYMLIGDYENAEKYLKESYEKNSRLWQALEKLGQIELLRGNKEKAKEYFDKAKEVNPQIKGFPDV